MLKDQGQTERRKVREGHKDEGEVDHRQADVLSGLPNFLSGVCHIGDVCSARHCFHVSATHGSYLRWLIFTGSQKKNKTNKSSNIETFVCFPSSFLRNWSEFGQAPGDHSATELICAIA